tara:strand:+ start:7346 stop:7504 length:159 start_codon:yes stop_codon:yes gene_type:complete
VIVDAANDAAIDAVDAASDAVTGWVGWLLLRFFHILKVQCLLYQVYTFSYAY